ncbi:restriction endonuclease subunit S [uncultured Candidatus Kuenenia sp.]|uniref:restriction endonuclease subunit S n=1 Tax=uncultured Candidatus Kuenenia sp. TaxID=1048336 RepID=UPI0002FDCD11|nr:restriction endonuclease subunit S [uncultured Candidatus Kuenenia sp.]
MSEWKKCKLGDELELIYGKGLKESERKKGNFPVYGSNGIVGYHNEYLVKAPGIIIGRKGSVGEIKFSKKDFFPIDTTYYVILKNDNDIIFFYYFLQTLQLNEMNSHSAVPGLNRNDVYAIDVAVPPLPEQCAIASVLSSLDDKIDLLHRQNKTLEAMAETLFRQWFIEPSLNPSQKEGNADEGWEEDSLLRLVQLVGGGTPKTSITDYWDGNIPWLAGGDIASNHKSFVLNTEKRITENGLNNSSAKLLPKYATVISARGTVGKYCLLAQPMAFSQSNYGILPLIDNCYFFTYLLINHVVEELQASAYGSVFDTITTTTFKENKVSIPNELEIRSFENLVSLYFHKIFQNKAQIGTLEKLRDVLLPKLMCGEVRLKI